MASLNFVKKPGFVTILSSYSHEAVIGSVL
mgnify:CR=1 FL=1